MEWAAAALLFLFLFVPFSYKYLKLPLLALLLIVPVLAIAKSRRLFLAKEILFVSLGLIVVSSLFGFYGIVQGHPGAFDLFRLYALWPIIYLLLISNIRQERHVRHLCQVLVFSAFAIAAYGILYVLTVAGFWPLEWFVVVQGEDAIQSAAIGFHDGFIEYRLLSITGMPFVIPFTMAALVTWPRDISPVPRLFLWATLIVSILAVLMTGRRGLWLVIAGTPVLIFILQKFITGPYTADIHRRRWRAVIAGSVLLGIAVALVASFLLFDFTAMLDQIISAFSSSSEYSGSVRYHQIQVFSREISERPWFGTGLGASAPEVTWKADKMQWVYEMMYLTLIYHVGIVGFAIYCLGIVWLFARAISLLRSGATLGILSLPLFVGCGAFLIANTTNPYLTSFEFMWAIFIPVGVINLYLLRHRAGAGP